MRPPARIQYHLPMSRLEWVLESTGNPRFPYRVSVLEGERALLCLWVQERWPGSKGNVFCLRDRSEQWEAAGDELERVGVATFKRYGKRLIVALDRAKNKRCDFLFLKKRYKSRPGEYEQIFWRTEKGLKERRTRASVGRYLRHKMRVVIDAGERYHWRFPGADILREQLPAGDYALLGEGAELIAVVERKTFDDFVASVGRLDAFHQQLAELASWRHCALVIEANYADFLNPKRLQGYFPPAFLSRVIAEISHAHPRLQVIFAGNRKLAAFWTQRYFFTVAAAGQDRPSEQLAVVAESAAEWEAPPRRSLAAKSREIIERLPGSFTVADLRRAFPELSESAVRRSLARLKSQGWVVCRGRGRGARWEKTGAAASLGDGKTGE